MPVPQTLADTVTALGVDPNTIALLTGGTTEIDTGDNGLELDTVVDPTAINSCISTGSGGIQLDPNAPALAADLNAGAAAC